MRRLVFLFACGIPWLLAAGPAGAVEPWQPFLDRLRQAQMFDMALAYLDQMATSPLCPSELKDVLDYEAGVTLMAQSRTLRAPSERAQALDAAQQRLGAFLSAHRDHPMAASATIQLANVLVERGRMKAEDAQRPVRLPDEKKQLLEEARALYDEAKKEFTRTEEHFVEALKGLPTGLIDPKDVKLIDRRAQARRDLVQARIVLATVVHEQAMTYPEESKRRKELLKDAAARFHDVFDKFNERNVYAAPFARMNEGRCHKELGDFKRAGEIFDELLLGKGDQGPMRDLKIKTLVLALQVALDPKVNKPAEAIEKYEAWLAAAPGVESNPDAMAARILGGRAYLEAARALGASDPKRTKLVASAYQTLEFVTRFPGEQQREARVLLLDPLFGKRDAPETTPTTFAEARDRGRAAFERAQVADAQDRIDLQRGVTENHERYVKEIAEGRADAKRCYQMALGMIAPETPVEDVNVIRYHLAHLCLSEEDYYDAAVLGEFLADRYPESAAARPAALVALGAFARLFNAAAPGPTKDFAHARMIAVANAITERWPASTEAADAWASLAQMAILGGDLARAREYFEKLPADAPGRATAALRLGRALWEAYLDANRADAPGAAPPPEREATLAQARTFLADGLARLPDEEEVDLAVLAAALSLAQIDLRDGKPADAAAVLENPKFGPLALVRAKRPAASGQQTIQETYKAALRAYVATRQLEKAEKAMDALEKAIQVGGDAEAAATLTRIYVALGRELQDLLESLRKEGKSQEMAQVAEGFELFLDRIAQRDEGNTFNSLYWVARTLSGMAAGFDAPGGPPSAEAEKYYKKAAAAHQKILDLAKKDNAFAPAGATWGVEVGLATCLRRLGQYDKAMNGLVDVLRQRNTMVDAQVEAARTYQEWAATPGNAKYYLFAISGGRAWQKDGRRVNIVWGWGKIAKMVSRSAKHMDVFHEARLNLARCRLEYALTLSGAERKSTLQQAERDVTVTALLYPELGGPKWRGQYDSLLKKIQELLGKKPVGLEKP
ncbi:MAG: hypothetical protein JW809_13340 [Pirellulales bacterium]|nr:hypothetical protein [Pirellulales bacterium]